MKSSEKEKRRNWREKQGGCAVSIRDSGASPRHRAKPDGAGTGLSGAPLRSGPAALRRGCFAPLQSLARQQPSLRAQGQFQPDGVQKRGGPPSEEQAA
jgi:hypothetical protein